MICKHVTKMVCVVHIAGGDVAGGPGGRYVAAYEFPGKGGKGGDADGKRGGATERDRPDKGKK